MINASSATRKWHGQAVTGDSSGSAGRTRSGGPDRTLSDPEGKPGHQRRSGDGQETPAVERQRLAGGSGGDLQHLTEKDDVVTGDDALADLAFDVSDRTIEERYPCDTHAMWHIGESSLAGGPATGSEQSPDRQLLVSEDAHAEVSRAL
jgi:hypothetical protein